MDSSFTIQQAQPQDTNEIIDCTNAAYAKYIPAHPQFAISETPGYRLLEHAYAVIIQQLPAELKTTVPVWDQIYMEEFHSGFVNGFDIATWDDVLQLKPV